MNIMLFSNIIGHTGVGWHINILSDALVRQGHNVVVVSGTQDLEFVNDKVEFVKVDTLSNNPIKMLKTVRAIKKIIKERNIDIVHCHHRRAGVYMKLYSLFNRKTPFVWTLHSANAPTNFMRRKTTFIGKRAIGVSTDVSDVIVKKLNVPASKVSTVFNGVDDLRLSLLSAQERDEIRKEWGIPEDSFVIAQHSRIHEVKNHLLVVEAVNRLTPEERKKLKVVCSGATGGRYYSRVVALAEEYGVLDNFCFVGWVDTRKILGISDFLFLPSSYEGFPLSVVEAFMMKLPVARSEKGGFKDQKYCLPISSTDPGDMVDIIRDALVNGTDKYKDRIDAAYRFAKENLTVDKMAENTVKIYEEVCLNDGKK